MVPPSAAKMGRRSQPARLDGRQRLRTSRSAGLAKAARYGELLGPVRSLPIPPEVEKAVKREVDEMAGLGRPLGPEACRRLTEDFVLQYYFGGQPFAYRETDQGKEILAVGFRDMGRLIRQMSPREIKTVVSGFAEPW
jgi:hypothetical protein